MPQIMTPHQAFNLSMNQYPSLYTHPVLEQAKLTYYDHVFNVIGNGYRDMDKFINSHTINEQNKAFINDFPEKYITKEPLYCAYTELDEKRSIPMGKYESQLPGLYTKEELKNMPEVKHKLQVNKKYREVFVPYPNFQKQYSLIWKDVSSLDKSWFEEAHFFYTKCKEFFASEYVHLYHNSYPKDEKAWEKLILDYEANFPKYKKPDMDTEQYYQAITKAYGAKYNGDTKEFIKNRWKNEHASINVFLDETLERLTTLINQATPSIKVKII